MTLLLTEAEYVAMSEVCAELIFITQIFEFIDLKIKWPMVIGCDNTGGMHLPDNMTQGARTKHIDKRMHYIRKYVRDGIVNIIYVKTKDNEADIFTKNVTWESHKKHSFKCMEDDIGEDSNWLQYRKDIRNWGISVCILCKLQ